MKRTIVFPAMIVLCATILCGCVAKKDVDLDSIPTSPVALPTAAPTSTAQIPASAIPEELVGTWTGIGEPVSGGDTIDLTVVICADATGEYTFVQAGYKESYPFEVEWESESFMVNIPKDNQLGISQCTGTYEYSAATLTLHITTEFSSGRSYAYTAICVKEPDAQALNSTDAENMTLVWRGHTMNVLYALDDDTIKSGSEEADGKYVKLILECTDGELSWEEITGYADFSLLNGDGNVYTAESTGFMASIGQSTDLADMETIHYKQIHPIFDIPKGTSLDGFTLRYDPNAQATLALKGIPMQKPEQ